jgi:hypothetical protein
MEIETLYDMILFGLKNIHLEEYLFFNRVGKHNQQFYVKKKN